MILVDISQEPFFRSLLIAAYRDRLRCLKQRSNVSIPKAFGRAMFGIIDESQTLEYGEVFIQHTSTNQFESEIVLGYVVVTKNPCLYPGDMRILKAIDVPHLHHLHDCIVFPCQGQLRQRRNLVEISFQMFHSSIHCFRSTSSYQ